jgi:phage terminase large subunit-like protein
LGDLRPGDLVFDEHGRPTLVALAHPVHIPPALRVGFDDGATIDVSTEHLWLVRGEVITTKALCVGDPMSVAPTVEGPCRIDTPSNAVRRVSSVVPIEPVPMRCITVDNPSGLFLIGKRHLVTHNSYALLLDAACYADIPGWNGIVLRRKHNDLTKGGGIFVKAEALFDIPGVDIRHGPLDIAWPSGAVLEFNHLSPENYRSYAGLEFAWIGIDEATLCESEHIKFLITRLRTATGVIPLLRMTCNPDPDHELRDWVDWYLLPDGTADREKSGVIRHLAINEDTDEIEWGSTPEEAAAKAKVAPSETMSFSFISALVEDNKILLANDPKYTTKLGMKGRVLREQLRRGNWNVRESIGGMLRRERWGGADEHLRQPIAQIVKWVRAWDKAATKPSPGGKDPDFTVGVLMGWDIHGRFYVAHMVACREEPTEVAELQRKTAKADGPKVAQSGKISGGDTGISDFKLNSSKELAAGGGRVHSIRELSSKTVRIQPMADALARGMIGNVPAMKQEREDGEDGEDWLPRGWILDMDTDTATDLGMPHCAEWTGKVYKDAGKSPRTLEGLFWSQVDEFPNVEHDDAPDAMGDGFSILSAPPKPKQPTARDRLTLITRR